jgi:AraC-like DNA-binding protein/mannose-6-phosphate isomerase-like protein (cupin superfamily)
MLVITGKTLQNISYPDTKGRCFMFSIDRDKTLSILNGIAGQLVHGDISYNILYWGISPSHKDNPVHRHSFFEVCYVIDGHGSYMDDNRHYPLRKGTLFCSRPGVVHQIRSHSGLYLLFVAFEINEAKSSPEFIAKYQSLYNTDCIILMDADQTPTALIWKALITQFEQPNKLIASSIRSTAHALLLSFFSGFTDQIDELTVLSTQKPNGLYLRRAITFIGDNLWRPLPLDTVAEYLHVSCRHLSRLFVKEMGLSYVEYVSQERVKHATNLLQYTDMPIKDVAEKTGFSSVHYFSYVFTKATGMPPGRFRASKATQGNQPHSLPDN